MSRRKIKRKLPKDFDRAIEEADEKSLSPDSKELLFLMRHCPHCKQKSNRSLLEYDGPGDDAIYHLKCELCGAVDDLTEHKWEYADLELCKHVKGLSRELRAGVDGFNLCVEVLTDTPPNERDALLHKMYELTDDRIMLEYFWPLISEGMDRAAGDDDREGGS